MGSRVNLLPPPPPTPPLIPNGAPLISFFLDNSHSFESSLKVANPVTRTLLTWATEAGTQISSNGWLSVLRHQE